MLGFPTPKASWKLFYASDCGEIFLIFFYCLLRKLGPMNMKGNCLAATEGFWIIKISVWDSLAPLLFSDVACLDIISIEPN